MSERKKLFVECRKCSERWKIATIPMAIKALVAATKGLRCPNCSASAKDVVMCPTEGEGAVTEPRDGKALDALP